jgi:hypothetical protein
MLSTLQIPQHTPYSDRTTNNTPHGNGGGFRTLTFGVPLGDQMVRDQVEVPKIVVKCCDTVEKYGLDLQGIYRISGTMTKVQELRRRVDLSECPFAHAGIFKGLIHNDV